MQCLPRSGNCPEFCLLKCNHWYDTLPLPVPLFFPSSLHEYTNQVVNSLSFSKSIGLLPVQSYLYWCPNPECHKHAVLLHMYYNKAFQHYLDLRHSKVHNNLLVDCISAPMLSLPLGYSNLREEFIRGGFVMLCYLSSFLSPCNSCFSMTFPFGSKRSL